MWIAYIPKDCSATGDFLCWFQAAYELRISSYGHKTVPQYAYARHFRLDTCWFLFMCCGCGMCSQATPGHVLQAGMSLLATNCVSQLEDYFVQEVMLLCLYSLWMSAVWQPTQIWVSVHYRLWQVCRQQIVSSWNFNYRFLYLAHLLEGCLVQQRTPRGVH